MSNETSPRSRRRKALRVAKFDRQADLAAAAGVSEATVLRWEAGESVSLGTVAALAAALDVEWQRVAS